MSDDELQQAIDALQGDRSESPPQDGAEQRVHQRFRINIKVHIRLSNGDLVVAQGVNLSMGGIYIEYGAAADVGSEFEMMFDLSFNNEFKRVFAKGKVVRCVIVGGKDVYGIAFSFTNFAKDSEQVLDKYLGLRDLKQSSI